MKDLNKRDLLDYKELENILRSGSFDLWKNEIEDSNKAIITGNFIRNSGRVFNIKVSHKNMTEKEFKVQQKRLKRNDNAYVAIGEVDFKYGLMSYETSSKDNVKYNNYFHNRDLLNKLDEIMCGNYKIKSDMTLNQVEKLLKEELNIKGDE